MRSAGAASGRARIEGEGGVHHPTSATVIWLWMTISAGADAAEAIRLARRENLTGRSMAGLQ